MFGAVWFDDETRPQGGWASVRGKPAFRVRGTGELATDVVWWTNLPSLTFYKYGGGLPSARLKRTDYIRPQMHQLHQELGLLTVRMPHARIIEICAEIFDRVMRLAKTHYGFDVPPDQTLAEDLYGKLIKPDAPITPDVDEALTQSYQTWFACQAQLPENSRTITFRRPRVQHAMDVLGTPVPGEQWEFMDDRKLPPQNKRVDWIVGQSRPALVRAAVKSVDHDVSSVVTLGQQGSGGRQRAWMSHPELLALSKFAHIKIDAAFLGSEYAPCHVNHQLYTGGPMGSLSVSLGILCENYVHALSNPRTYRRTGRDKIYSPRAVWYAASDRFYMLMPAMMMHGSGFTVRGYGRGMVTIAVPRGAIAEARTCAAAAGLVAPLFLQEEVGVQTALASS